MPASLWASFSHQISEGPSHWNILCFCVSPLLNDQWPTTSFNPLHNTCDASIVSSILQTGKLRGSERVSYLTKVTQLLSVRPWIQTQISLLSKAQHPSSRVPLSLSESPKIMEKKMLPEKELDSRPSVESGSPSVQCFFCFCWFFFATYLPLRSGYVWLPFVSQPALMAEPALCVWL